MKKIEKAKNDLDTPFTNGLNEVSSKKNERTSHPRAEVLRLIGEDTKREKKHMNKLDQLTPEEKIALLVALFTGK